MIFFILSRYKYSDGVFPGQFRNSGVKMLIPLVVVPECQEHYENVRDIKQLVDVNGVDSVSESSDIKMILIEQGKQGAQSTHPCIFGDGKPPFTKVCTLLTVGDLRRAYER